VARVARIRISNPVEKSFAEQPHLQGANAFEFASKRSWASVNRRSRRSSGCASVNQDLNPRNTRLSHP
jgi:hypothetical protein